MGGVIIPRWWITITTVAIATRSSYTGMHIYIIIYFITKDNINQQDML
jgi:hypothetical protein